MDRVRVVSPPLRTNKPSAASTACQNCSRCQNFLISPPNSTFAPSKAKKNPIPSFVFFVKRHFSSWFSPTRGKYLSLFPFLFRKTISCPGLARQCLASGLGRLSCLSFFHFIKGKIGIEATRRRLAGSSRPFGRFRPIKHFFSPIVHLEKFRVFVSKLECTDDTISGSSIGKSPSSPGILALKLSSSFFSLKKAPKYMMLISRSPWLRRTRFSIVGQKKHNQLYFVFFLLFSLRYYDITLFLSPVCPPVPYPPLYIRFRRPEAKEGGM